MAISSSSPETFEAPRKHRLLLGFTLLLLALSVAAVLYLTSQKSAIADEHKRLSQQMSDLRKEEKQLLAQNLQFTEAAQSFLAQLEKNEIQWSRVLTRIQSLIPYDDAKHEPKVTFLSYSAAPGGKVTINAQSQPSPIAPFESLSDLIRVFNESAYFEGAYIPTITRGETETGDTVLSFAFSVTYDESHPTLTPVTSSDTTDTVSQPSFDSSESSANQPKVSRQAETPPPAENGSETQPSDSQNGSTTP